MQAVNRELAQGVVCLDLSGMIGSNPDREHCLPSLNQGLHNTMSVYISMQIFCTLVCCAAEHQQNLQMRNLAYKPEIPSVSCNNLPSVAFSYRRVTAA